MSEASEDVVREIAASYGTRPEMLVQILQTLVGRHGWISEANIRQLAGLLNLSRAEVHGVVAYYHDFRTEPPGRHIVKICQAEACQAMGCRALTEHAERSLAMSLHEHGEAISLEPVYCLGNCALAPAVMIDGTTHGRVDAARFDALVGALQGGD